MLWFLSGFELTCLLTSTNNASCLSTSQTTVNVGLMLLSVEGISFSLPFVGLGKWDLVCPLKFANLSVIIQVQFFFFLGFRLNSIG